MADDGRIRGKVKEGIHNMSLFSRVDASKLRLDHGEARARGHFLQRYAHLLLCILHTTLDSLGANPTGEAATEEKRGGGQNDGPATGNQPEGGRIR